MTRISRRRFLGTSALTMTAAGLTPMAGRGSAGAQVAPGRMPAAARATGRPNVLWIQTDEQRPDSLGCYGSEWAHTPNVDRLAREGAVFRECHVQSPVCVPARTSQITGRYPQETGIFDNKYYYERNILPPNLVTFPQAFSSAGYNVASIGKWHTPDHPIWQYNNPWQHFDTLGPAMVRDPEQEEKARIIRRPRGAPLIIGGIYPEDERWGTDMGSHHTDLALAWLRENANGPQPFFFRVSYLWPHTPAVAPRPWHRLYEGKNFIVPIDHREEMYANRSLLDRQLSDEQGGNEFDRETWEWICQTYYGCCAYIDHQIGRLLFALEEMGLMDNTIIAFTSDHGRNNGEYGCCEKSTFDHEVWRVPQVIRYPEKVAPGQVRTDICEGLDLGPTLMSLAGVERPAGFRGRDLFNSEEPDAVHGVIERGGGRDVNNPHADENRGHRRLAIRTKRWRYDFASHLHNKELAKNQQHPSLYDIENDPLERFNLINDPRHRDTVSDLHAQLLDWFHSVPYRSANEQEI